MEKKEKKLALEKETLINLNESEMNDIAGGGTFQSMDTISMGVPRCKYECTDWCLTTIL